MSQYNQAAVSKGTLVFIISSVVVVGLIMALGIMPAKSKKAGADLEAIRLESLIEEQKILMPLYVRLSQKLANKPELEKVLDQIEPLIGPLYIGDVPQVLSTMAGTAGLSEVYFVPVPESVTKDSSRLLVDGGFKGQYTDFRNFLLNLFAWKNFSQMETMEVKSTPQGTDYTIRLWVSLG